MGRVAQKLLLPTLYQSDFNEVFTKLLRITIEKQGNNGEIVQEQPFALPMPILLVHACVLFRLFRQPSLLYSKIVGLKYGKSFCH